MRTLHCAGSRWPSSLPCLGGSEMPSPLAGAVKPVVLGVGVEPTVARLMRPASYRYMHPSWCLPSGMGPAQALRWRPLGHLRRERKEKRSVVAHRRWYSGSAWALTGRSREVGPVGDHDLCARRRAAAPRGFSRWGEPPIRVAHQSEWRGRLSVGKKKPPLWGGAKVNWDAKYPGASQ